MENFLPNPTLMIMVGLPGSGKSTYIQKFLKDHENYVVISSDSLIEDYAKSVNKTYDEVFSEYIDTANKLVFKLFSEALINKKNIIVDRTNMTIGARKKFLSQVSNSYLKAAYIFEVDRKTLDERLEKRKNQTGKSIPVQIIDSMFNNYQVPTESEGFNVIIKIAQ